MRRRDFITLIGGGLVSWPTRTYAQQIPAPLHRIGILAQDLQPGLLEAFRDELHKLGYVEGTNTTIELRNAAGENERLPGLAAELLGLKVGVRRPRKPPERFPLL
jgi:putative ABC transport system substrate-binding protein